MHVFDTTKPPYSKQIERAGVTTKLPIKKSIQGQHGRWTITDANLSPDNERYIATVIFLTRLTGIRLIYSSIVGLSDCQLFLFPTLLLPRPRLHTWLPSRTTRHSRFPSSSVTISHSASVYGVVDFPQMVTKLWLVEVNIFLVSNCEIRFLL